MDYIDNWKDKMSKIVKSCVKYLCQFWFRGHDPIRNMKKQLGNVESDGQDNLRAKIQFKIKQQASLLSQLAHSLSDDISETSSRAQENLDISQTTASDGNTTSIRGKKVLEADDVTEDGKLNVQQNLVQHLKNEYEDLSGLLEKMKVTMGDIMDSLSLLDNAPGINSDKESHCNCMERPFLSVPEKNNVQIYSENFEKGASVQNVGRSVLMKKKAFQERVEQREKAGEPVSKQQMALLTYTSDMLSQNETESMAASTKKQKISTNFKGETEAHTFSLDINIQAQNQQGPRSMLESRHLLFPQWEYPGLLILYNSPNHYSESFSETLLKKSFVNINNERLIFGEDKHQFPDTMDHVINPGEEDGDIGFLYAMGDEYIHTRFRSPSPKRNSQKIVNKNHKTSTPQLCPTCRSVNVGNSARNELTKSTVNNSPSKWLYAKNMKLAHQHEKDTKPSRLACPVTGKYHGERKAQENLPKGIERKQLGNKPRNTSHQTKTHNKRVKRAESYKINPKNSNSRSEASFTLHKETPSTQKSRQEDNVKILPVLGRSRVFPQDKINNLMGNPVFCSQRGQTRSASSPGSPVQRQRSTQTPWRKSKTKPTQSFQHDKNEDSVLNLTIEIPSPTDVSQPSYMGDADTVVHINESGSLGGLSIALQTDDINSLKMRNSLSDDKVMDQYYNRSHSLTSASSHSIYEHQMYPKRTRWGVAQIDEFGDGTQRFKIFSGNPSRVEIIITIPKSM